MKKRRILLLVETSRAYGRGLLEGIAKYSHLYGHWQFFNELGQENMTIPQILELAPDGIFAQANKAKTSKEFLPKNIPSVILSGDAGIVPGFPNIIDNWLADGKMAAEHLLEKGFKRFAYCGFEHCNWSQKREKAFAGSIVQAGFVTFHQNTSKEYRPREINILCQWVKSLPKPIGIMACNDDRARHVLEACQICEVKVPEEVAIIGVDNDPLRCDMADPPLSSIARNCSAVGFEAAQILDNMMTTGKKTEKLIKVEPICVHTRRSTDTLAVEDSEVASALRYIRLNAKKQITVQDVADAVATSRRSLERRFAKILNSTVMQNIRKERVAQMSLILVSTNLPISKIAADFNMCSFTYFANYFKKEAGMSPREYRRKFGII
jgi:LacI family transcriptional regulator